ncbi:MAG: hypothetical protein OXE78_09270 [Gammaproteobacteria bacterium]|nr:hypothetical protein [Gammaproteobacteria bacterium]MCY4359036.1 hypothetical protein [Gammaproteobacteria bacterium]
MPVFHIRTGLFALTVLFSLTTCTQEQNSQPAAVTVSSYNTSLSVQEIMALVLEPAADILWDSGGWILDSTGYRELYPTTDEGWDYLQAQAAIVVESGNSLALPGRAEDNDAWMIFSEGLSQAGVNAMESAAARDEEAFFQAGAQLYSVCTACHQAYNPDINNRFGNEEAD